MERMLKYALGRLSTVAKRLREDRGAITVEAVLWTFVVSTMALTVGAIIYQLVLTKAHSLHF
ncbi:hypothetical protein KGQ19_01265 [Catenulispora sp. NL8]|uniref:Uncharacterized protein n=1 Tax=Catenulispora pinistramenti TaxID=2705254 RepID=A0ABS5KGZ1_9ACTN|nr:hypothetical protein [Catenulispora pinistramenti]MBS2545489.1 hypothetical protein [Catenulispora pinistramenti]